MNKTLTIKDFMNPDIKLVGGKKIPKSHLPMIEALEQGKEYKKTEQFKREVEEGKWDTPEHYQSINSTYSKTVKRQPITESRQDQVWNRDRGRCVRCETQGFLCYDHIIPVTKYPGFPDNIDWEKCNQKRNLQLLCVKCNGHKSNKDWDRLEEDYRMDENGERIWTRHELLIMDLQDEIDRLKGRSI